MARTIIAVVSSHCHSRFLTSLLPSAEEVHHVAEEIFCTLCLGCGSAPAVICAFGALALLAGQSRTFAGDDLLHGLKPIIDVTLAKPAAADWPMRRGNFAAWGFSTLEQINTQNVGRLRLAWAWNMEPGYQ
jgi:hypothetical protein